MFSNLVSEPIEDGGQIDKSEKGGGEFFLTGGNTPVNFDATEEVFDLVAAAVVAAMKAGGVTASACGWNATAGFLAVQPLPENIGIEALVGDDPAPARTGQHRSDRMLVVLRPGRETEGHRPPVLINQRGELGVESAFGSSHRLGALAAGGIGSVLMQLDV